MKTDVTAKNELQSLTFPLDISQTKKDRKLQKKRLKILFPDLKKFLGFQSGRIVNINNQKFSLKIVRIIMNRVSDYGLWVTKL